jgi:hypothetical protein
MTFKANFPEIARRVESAAEMETFIWVDALPQDPNWAVAAGVQSALRSCLSTATDLFSGADPATGRSSIRKALLKEINSASLQLLNMALTGYQALGSVPVGYLINMSNRGNKPDWNRFDFLDFPFINGHQEMLEAALRIRNESTRIQRLALKMARYKSELQAMDDSAGMNIQDGLQISKKAALEQSKLLESQAKLRKVLPMTVITDVDAFYGYIAPGSVHPEALPIEIAEAARSEHLRELARVYRYFGDDLRIPFDLRITGKAPEIDQAQAARVMYEGAGLGFKVLAAWVMAVDLINDRRQCSICYRHIGAIARCAVHATTTQETREARLGKRVRPIYEKRLWDLSQEPLIRKRLGNSLSWSAVEEGELITMAKQAGLSASHLGKAVVLGSQLMQLSIVGNIEMAARVKQLFTDILGKVRWIEGLPMPVGNIQADTRKRQNECARELLSLKGFFRAWCGDGSYSRDVPLKMLGFDRYHPVAQGSALDSQGVPMSLLSQRAWEESLLSFTTSTSPTTKDIRALLEKGASMKEVAKKLGICLATVYNILNRDGKDKRRNFLGHR